jgi:hypothetical protein
VCAVAGWLGIIGRMTKDRTRRRELARDLQIVVERSSTHPVEYAIVLVALDKSLISAACIASFGGLYES